MCAAPEAVSELRGASGVCVSQMLPSTSVLKRQSQDEGVSGWACVDHRAASWES